MHDSSQTPATMVDYCKAVSRFTEAIDRILHQGRALERRYENFCDVNGLRPGEGEEKLCAADLSENQRRIHWDLLRLNERLYDDLLHPSFSRSVNKTTRAISPRALSSKTRI